MSNNIFQLAYKTILIALPFIGSVLIFLTLLNISIWIYDDTKVKASIKKSKKVLLISVIIFLCLTLIISIYMLFFDK
jgi:hypothetical protein